MLERTVVPETSRPSSGLHLPTPASPSSQLSRFGLIVLVIGLMTFIMVMYVLPNSQINAAETQIAQLQAEKAELQRQNAEVLREIARYSDLTSLQVRARQLGMGPVQSAIYLTMPLADVRQEGEQGGQPADAGARTAAAAGADVSGPAFDIQQEAGAWLNRTTRWLDGIASRFVGH